MKFRFILFLIGTLAYSQQDSLIIDRQDLNDWVQNNLQLKIDESEIASEKTDLLQFRASKLPHVRLSYSGINTNNPLMALGSKLNQAVVRPEDFNPDLLNDPKAIFNFETKLEVEQSLYNREVYWQRKATEVKIKALELKASRTKDFLEMEVNIAYMMLQFAYKSVEVLKQAQKTSIANKKVIDDYYANGLIQKSDVLYMETRLNEIESQLFSAKSNIQNISDYLLILGNQELGSVIFKPIDALVFDPTLDIFDDHLNTERADILSQTQALEAYDMMLKSSKAQFIPNLFAFGNFAFHDENPIGFGANGYLIGVAASWNLFDAKKSDSEQKKYLAEKTKAGVELENYKQHSQLELNMAKRNVLDAKKRVELSELAWEQTKVAYEIQKNRFQQGLEKAADLLSSESIMSQKELELHQAIYEHNAAIEYLKYLNH